MILNDSGRQCTDSHFSIPSQGGSKIQEGFYIFQELCEKYSWTVLLMNGAALCHMHMGHFEAAETLLLEALNKVWAASRGCLHARSADLGWEGWDEGQDKNGVLEMFFDCCSERRMLL